MATDVAQPRVRVRHPAMFQGWRCLTFLHWPCDARALQARVPARLRIDVMGGVGWVGLTPFRLTGLRPAFLPPLPGLSSFPEMNLRTYVHGPAGRGIWFFSLDAASTWAVVGARLTYGLPYHRARMAIRTRDARVEYTSARSDARASIAVDVGSALPDPDELTRFLTERYRLYAQRGGALAFAEVEHEPWGLHRAKIIQLKETVRRAADLDFGDAPALVHWSPGVSVRVGWPRRA